MRASTCRGREREGGRKLPGCQPVSQRALAGEGCPPPSYLEGLGKEEALQQGEEHAGGPVGSLGPAQLQAVQHGEEGCCRAHRAHRQPAEEWVAAPGQEAAEARAGRTSWCLCRCEAAGLAARREGLSGTWAGKVTTVPPLCTLGGGGGLPGPPSQPWADPQRQEILQAIPALWAASCRWRKESSGWRGHSPPASRPALSTHPPRVRGCL